MNLIDAHVHLWDPKRLRYPWLEDLEALRRPFLPADYHAACGPARVSRMVFVECACDPAQRTEEVAWVTQIARSEPRLAGIIAQVPLEAGTATRDELRQLAGNALVKGIRRILQGEEDQALATRPAFVEGVRSLAQHAFTFDLCVQHSQLPGAIELVRLCPDTQFVLDHCGKPAIRDRQLDPWRKQIRDLAELPNVACKLSGLPGEADPGTWTNKDLKPYVDHVLESFGPDRVLFAGDWPVCTLAHGSLPGWLEALQELTAGQTAEERAKLFSRNASRIYRLT